MSNMGIRYLFLISFVLNFYSANCQDFVNNSSFDEYENYYDDNYNLVYSPKYWFYNPTERNHPIYYSTDRYKNKSINRNFHPDSALINRGGNVNYISVSIFPNIQKAYTVLKKPLEKDKKYHLNIDLKALNQSNCFSDLLVGFKDCDNCNLDSCLYQLKLVIPDELCNDQLFKRWITLNINFVAQGNEKVLIITSGSSADYLKIINSNKNKYFLRKNQEHPKLLYYIDNVNITEEIVNAEDIKTTIIDSFIVGENIVLKNIYFEFDKYEILEQSFPELDMIFKCLDRYKNFKVEIYGYTDSNGTEEYNDTLSFRRAQSVRNYLIEKGINRERFQVKGYGSKYPIASNDYSEGRRMNRRIEMKLLEK